MAFRFRKSVKIAPGVRLNVGKKSASVTVGGRRARVTSGTAGTTVSASVPGTGMGVSSKLSSGSKRASSRSSANTADDTNGGDLLGSFGVLASLAGFLFPPILLVSLPAIFFGFRHSKRVNEERERQGQLADLSHELAKCAGKVDSAKTLNTKMKNCISALQLLDSIHAIDPKEKTINNQSQLRRVLTATQRVLPVTDALDKAEVKFASGDYKPALRYAKKALDLQADKQPADTDFALLQAKAADGTAITVEYLHQFLEQIERQL